MTAMYTERVQTVLTKEQFDLLSATAQQENKPLSVLVREAVEEVYFVQEARRRRRHALDQLVALDAPVEDWPEMEREIIEGATS
jgi:hypothetical protein